MQPFPDIFRREHLARSPVSRVLLALVALVLALQLIGTAFHKHDVTEQSPDCISCDIAAHFITNVPAVNGALQAVFLLVVYWLARLPQFITLARQSYLIPLAQAPPRFFLPV